MNMGAFFWRRLLSGNIAVLGNSHGWALGSDANRSTLCLSVHCRSAFVMMVSVPWAQWCTILSSFGLDLWSSFSMSPILLLPSAPKTPIGSHAFRVTIASDLKFREEL